MPGVSSHADPGYSRCAFRPEPNNHEEGTMKARIAMIVAALAAGAPAAAQAADKAARKAPAKKPPMSFFVTSANPGKGADFGGLAGADRHCQLLASVAGESRRTWRAYLSTSAYQGGKVVNARDRIGKGPWYNAKGELIARNVEDLHTAPNIDKDSALTEKGERVKVRGDTPNEHDILTGSDSQGRAFPGTSDTTCSNWTSGADGGSAQVGHVDRAGLSDHPAAKSWNHAHPSRGCSMPRLRSSGGGGLLYCFAAN
jgi:hypothetical protein